LEGQKRKVVVIIVIESTIRARLVEESLRVHRYTNYEINNSLNKFLRTFCDSLTRESY
jgi:hypothetical protein